MTELTIKLDENMLKYIMKKNTSKIDEYIAKLIKEDMLLNEINESKKSWEIILESIDDLDD